jgi:hypothetical protein
MKLREFTILVTFVSLLVCMSSINAQTIWTGPTMIFTKADNVDWTLQENQDRITPNVWITRANSQGIFNIVTEAGYQEKFSPQDTRWAFGTTDNYQTLSYDPWEETIGTPPQMMDQDMVVHLMSDDIYIDIKFTVWTGGANGGGFTYERSTSPPLGMDDLTSNDKPILYPSPAHNFIQISNLITQEKYQIYNALGSQILEGTMGQNDRLNVQNFKSGIYFIRFEGGTTLRFIKI